MWIEYSKGSQKSIYILKGQLLWFHCRWHAEKNWHESLWDAFIPQWKAQRRKNKTKDSKGMKRALKVAKCTTGKIGTVQFKPLFNRPKRFCLACGLPTQAKFVAQAF